MVLDRILLSTLEQKEMRLRPRTRVVLDKERFNDVHCGDGAFDWCSTGRLIIISAAVLGLFFVSTAVLCVKMIKLKKTWNFIVRDATRRGPHAPQDE